MQEKHLPSRLNDKPEHVFCPTMLLNRRKYQFENNNSDRVGFVFAGDRRGFRYEDVEQFLERMKDLVSKVSERGYETVLINHAGRWVNKHIDFDDEINLEAEPTKEVYKTYSNIDTVFGTRGHSLMIPVACGCKVISITTQNKQKWVLEDMNLEDSNIKENHPNLVEKLLTRFDELQDMDWDSKNEEIINNVEKHNSQKINRISNIMESQ